MHFNNTSIVIAQLVVAASIFGCSSDATGPQVDSTAKNLACAEPTQAPIGDDWPEVFLGVADCSDVGQGTRAEPFCSFGKAMEASPEVGSVVTVLDGTYRLMDQPDEFRGVGLSRRGTAESYFVLRADEGATPVFIGSIALPGAEFTQEAAGVYRFDASGLRRDPKGVWTSEGVPLIHQNSPMGRQHADASELTIPGTWTKADAAGVACSGDRVGCFVYLLPATGTDMSTVTFEATQRSLGNFGPSDYFVMQGLSILYTQPQGFFFEAADHVVIEDNEVGYTANGNDNSYSMRMWDTNGTIVRRNRVHDSRYWGGPVNSHGITFMISGDEEENWVCDNEVYELEGFAISTKEGSLNHNVVGNYIHDCNTGVIVPGPRKTSQYIQDGGAYTIRQNIIERCKTGVTFRRGLDFQEYIAPSAVYNNSFLNCETGIQPSFDHPRPLIRNNLFQGGEIAIRLYTGNQSEYTTDWWLQNGLDSNNNLFDGPFVLDNKTFDEALNLSDYQNTYAGEAASLTGDAKLGSAPDYILGDSSPAMKAGDSSMYADYDTVSIGHRPLAHE